MWRGAGVPPGRLPLFPILSTLHLDLPGGSDGKASAYNAGDLGSIPGLGRSPGEGNGNPLTLVFLLGKSHGQSSLEGYNPRGCKESDTTEQLTHTPTMCPEHHASSLSDTVMRSYHPHFGGDRTVAWHS